MACRACRSLAGSRRGSAAAAGRHRPGYSWKASSRFFLIDGSITTTIIAVAATLVIHAAFASLLRVPLPWGVLPVLY